MKERRPVRALVWQNEPRSRGAYDDCQKRTVTISDKNSPARPLFTWSAPARFGGKSRDFNVAAPNSLEFLFRSLIGGKVCGFGQNSMTLHRQFLRPAVLFPVHTSRSSPEGHAVRDHSLRRTHSLPAREKCSTSCGILLPRNAR